MYRRGTAFHSPLSLSLSALKMCLAPYPAYNYQSNFSKVKETSVVKSEIVRRSCPGTDDSSNLSASPPSSDHALSNKIRVDWSSYVCLSSSFCSHSDFITPRGFPCKKQCFKHITDLLGLALSPKVHHLQPSSLEPRLVISFRDSSSLGGQQSWPRL